MWTGVGDKGLRTASSSFTLKGSDTALLPCFPRTGPAVRTDGTPFIKILLQHSPTFRMAETEGSEAPLTLPSTSFYGGRALCSERAWSCLDIAALLRVTAGSPASFSGVLSLRGWLGSSPSLVFPCLQGGTLGWRASVS
jgi:hypothetical protein